MNSGIGEPIVPSGADDGGAAPDEGREPSEEVLWKARALEAEEKLAACETRLVELEGELSSARESLAGVERRAEIERALSGASVVDLETAVMLTESAIAEMDTPDVAVAVRDLRARKPFLFGERGGGVSSAMGARSASDEDPLGDLAASARGSGDRAELLRYLRARRRG